MPANVETMAYYGEVPWHGLGTEVPKWVKAEEMIRAAGLDWKVELRPARGSRQINSRGIHSRYELIRAPRRFGHEQEILLGVVSNRYQPLQNVDAFRFFDPIVAQRTAYFETAGSLGEGERIWVMARMPDAMTIVPGDDCLKYLLLSNSHTGQGSVIVKFTSVRVVCQNTLMLAMDDGQKAFRVRHSRSMKLRLDELSEFVAITQKVFQAAEECLKHLARVQMTGDRLERYLESVYPRSEAQRRKAVTPESWDSLYEMFETRPDLQLPGVRGTLWAAYNAVTRFEDYKHTRNDSPDQRLERTWFGGGADTKLRALQTARELAASWN